MSKTFVKIAATVIAGLAISLSCVYVTNHKARISSFDVLTTPGKSVDLVAKLEVKAPVLMQKDIKDVRVCFLTGDKLIGSSVTDGEGKARVKYPVPPDAKGNVEITCRLAPRSGYTASASNLLVSVHDNSTEFLVCDIDHTIADVKSFEFLVTSNEKIPPLPGSVEVLRRLSKKYVVLYVTARDDAFTETTKEWLRMRGFPPGPVFFNDYGQKSTDSGKYKTAEIRNLKKRFPNITLGIGDKVHDAEAYLANGLRSIIIGKEKPGELPEKSEFVKSWADIEKLLPGTE